MHCMGRRVDVFLLPQTVRYEFSEDNLFDLKGISEKWDKKRIDLIRVIQVSDALNIKYQCTNVLTPLAYAESRKDILWHLNTQGVFVSKIVHGEILQWIKSESRKKYTESMNLTDFGFHLMNR